MTCFIYDTSMLDYYGFVAKKLVMGMMPFYTHFPRPNSMESLRFNFASFVIDGFFFRYDIVVPIFLLGKPIPEPRAWCIAI
jgi:hypothetical protein